MRETEHVESLLIVERLLPVFATKNMRGQTGGNWRPETSPDKQKKLSVRMFAKITELKTLQFILRLPRSRDLFRLA